MIPVSKEGNPPFDENNRRQVEEVLPGYLQKSRWFRGKARPMKTAVFGEFLSMHNNSRSWSLALVQVDYADG